MTSPPRLDWLLLLPASVAPPVPSVVVIGGSDEDAQGLIDGGVAREWARPNDRTERHAAPLVICRSDASCSIEDAARFVAPGGTLLVEVDRRRRGRRATSVARARRSLDEAGCTVHGVYVVSPTIDAPRRFLPLDAPTALRWHLHNLFVSASVPAWLARTALLALHRTPVGPALLAATSPRYIAIARRGTDGTRLEPVLGSPGGSDGERVVLLTSGYDAGSRGVVLPFVDGDRAPRRVVKVATSESFAAATRREHERLTELHDTLPHELRRTLPRPLGIVAVAGRTACIQTCATGRSLGALAGDVTRSNRAKRRDLAVAAAWLDGLAAATRVPTTRADQQWPKVYESAASLSSTNAAVRRLLELAAERVTAASDIAVYQHYDAGPWNVHISRRQPCFVDWESDDRRPADSLGPPLTDVLYLVTYWYFAVTRASARGTEEQALLDLFVTRMPRDAAIEAGRRTIDASLRRLDFARDSVPPLLTALWAERALYTDARHGPTETRSERDDSSSPERVMKAGLSRPESYLRTLASCSDELFATDGYWAFPVGTGVAHDHLSRRSTPIID